MYLGSLSYPLIIRITEVVIYFSLKVSVLTYRNLLKSSSENFEDNKNS